MNETDVLRGLVDGTLRMCDAEGCSNTFPREGQQRYCGQQDCARHTRPCSAPWCKNRAPSKKGVTVACSPECEEAIKAARGAVWASGFERRTVLRDTVAQMDDVTTNLGRYFQQVKTAVDSGDRGAIYQALVEAAAACALAAEQRGR